MSEEFVQELLKKSYRSLVDDYVYLTGLLNNYDLVVKHGIIKEKDINKSDLEEIVKFHKTAIRQKEREIVKEAFIRGR